MLLRVCMLHDRRQYSPQVLLRIRIRYFKPHVLSHI